MSPRPLRDRLYARLVRDPDTGCLLWTGCLNSRGYGVISVDGERELVHRVAWELANGPIADGLTIDHVHARGCRHKHCAEVAHLEPVTTRENIQRSWQSNPDRPYAPRPSLQARSAPDDFWRTFREWAGPDEWAELTPANRVLAEAAASP